MPKPIFIFFIVLLISSCITTKSTSNSSHSDSTSQPTVFEKNFGSSGMTQVNDSTFIVVYDVKNFKEGTRVGLIKVNQKKIESNSIAVDFWDEEGISSDLESICAIPNTTDEFLLAESGNWKGNLGRVFHIKLDLRNKAAKVLHSFKPQIQAINKPGTYGDQYEGIHCIKNSDNTFTIILAERGGSETNPNGIIRWGIWDMTTNNFSFTTNGRKGIQIDAPGNWTNTDKKRSLTDLYVDNDNTVWATASEDQGDAGPFYSTIYSIGNMDTTNSTSPFIPSSNLKVARHIYGFKLESLGGPVKGISSTHSFGTEDENYGGVWRPIYIK